MRTRILVTPVPTVTRALVRGAVPAVLASTVLLGSLLTGCAPLVVGGAAVGGALVATDRRSSGVQLEDQTLELKASSRIRSITNERSHVSVNSYNRQVLLTGEVNTEADKTAIEQAVRKLDGVKAVVNDLAVQWPSSATERSRDLVLAGKVKATYVDAGGLSANVFHVTVERGVVYLMGRVTEEEATRAIDLARSISGVQKVVRLLEIISPDQLNAIKGR